MTQELTRGHRIVVTGGAGFIGSHVVDGLLDRDNEVVVFDNFATGHRNNLSAHLKNRRLEIIEGDVRDLPALKAVFDGADVVFHLATHCVRLSLSEPMINHEVNATGTLNTLLAAKDRRLRKYVYCSSSEVYGNVVGSSRDSGVPSLIALSEESPKIPSTIYGGSKLVGEHYTLAFHQTYGMPAVVVRPFNAYGPRSHLHGPYGEVIPRFCILAMAGQAPVIFGDGGQTRDFTYVEDTAAGLVRAADYDSLLGGSVNIAYGREVSISELAEIVCELAAERTGRSLKPHHVGDRPGDIRRLGADMGKAKRVLDFEATISLREGLFKYLSWLDAQSLDYAEQARALVEKNWEVPPR